jgi:hypothetical protein
MASLSSVQDSIDIAPGLPEPASASSMRDAGQASRLSRLKLGTLSARAGFWRPGAFLCLIAIAGFTASPATASPGVPGPIDALTAVDVSDSMFGPGGSDPHGARYRAVEVAAAMLCLHSSAGIEHRIGVLPFGSTAPARLAGAPTDACNAQRFSPRRLRGIPRLGGTDYPTMLRAARQLLGRPVAGHSRVLMLVTDGRPHVAAGETLDALFLRVARELQALRGVRVHVVLINSDREVLRHWRSLPIAAVTPLRDVNRQALERVALRTLAYEFGLARREELTLKAGGASRGFTVPPYQDLLGLTVRARGREAEVTIDGPSGPYRIRTVAGGVGDISVPAPAPGRWTVRLTRGSGATLAVDRHEPTLRVIEPPAAAPAGRPLYIEATLTPLNGGQIRSRSADPVVVSARVTGADNQVVNTEMRETVPGRYRSTQPVDTRDAGAFTAVVTARGGGVPFSHATRRPRSRCMRASGSSCRLC